MTDLEVFIAFGKMLGLPVFRAEGVDPEHGLVSVISYSDCGAGPAEHVAICGYDNVEWLGAFDLDGKSIAIAVHSHVGYQPGTQEIFDRYEPIIQRASDQGKLTQ